MNKSRFNAELIEKQLNENTDFREVFASTVRRIGVYWHLSEMPMLGKSAEKVVMHMEALNDNRQKIIKALLYMNKNFSSAQEKLITTFVRNLRDDTIVQNELIEEFYALVWERDWMETQAVKEILTR